MTESIRGRAAWVAAILPAAVLAIGAWCHRWVCEDAFICFRVADQILAGNGPVFNAGERVEAYTSPAWMALLTLWQALGGRIEEGSLVLGILAAGVGVVTAVLAAARRHAPRAVVPFGALVLVVTTAVWDFAASGLEMGLVLAWLGTSYALLSRAASDRRASGAGAFAWFGIGILIRPDLGLFAIGFLLIALFLRRGMTNTQAGSIASSLVAFGAVPLLYLLFRMGYFAAWMSNSSIAKEPGLAHGTAGAYYLLDFVHVYRLWIVAPLVLLLAWLARSSRRIPLVGVEATFFALGVLHAVYVARVGGDFMHGRFVLPAYMAMLIPFFVLPVAPLRRPAAAVGALALYGWCAASAFVFGPHYRYNRRGVANERLLYIELAGRPHPVRLEDYDDTIFGREGRALRKEAELGGRRLLVALTDDPAGGYLPADARRVAPLSASLHPRITVAAPAWNIGIIGRHAGTRAFVADRLGLADPIGSRLRLKTPGRPGHEKLLPLAVVEARLTDPQPGERAEVTGARAMLAGPEARELIEATSAPMSVPRFFSNVLSAVRLTSLRFDFERLVPPR
ncbi:MAG TPA: glycosyltransferase family 39 protein [Candidatus Eisenbacteria bacterium]